MSRFVFHLAAAALFAASSAAPAFAEQTSDAHGTHAGPAATSAAALSPGEVRKVDRAAKKITIKHGPIAGLDMPAMTMVYPVADAVLLDGVKPGDRILFAAEKTGDTFTVTRIETRR